MSECATGQPEEGEAINNLHYLIPTNVSATLVAIDISVREYLFDSLVYSAIYSVSDGSVSRVRKRLSNIIDKHTHNLIGISG